MPIKVSVIVPVYNTEKYLDTCLSSLVSQALEDLEIIVVNDGSPDNSQDIIDRYVSKYPEMIVAIGQENKGLGMARNAGIAVSRGQYIGFVDSDDYVEPDMFEQLYTLASVENSDIAMCDFMCFFDDGTEDQYASGWPGNKEHPESISDYVLYSTNPSYSWNRIYKKELLLETPFPEGFYEDIATTPIVTSHSEIISYLKKPLYHYLRRRGAISTQKYNPRNLDLIPAWRRCLSECNEKYIKEAEYAVYFSISKFLEYKRDCYPAFMEYFKENENRFKDNEYIREAILNNEIDNLFYFKVIPKKIHYCLFDAAENKEQLFDNINLWREIMPDYEIIEWKEYNPFKILYEHGGIFLDAGIVLQKSLNEFLRFDAFFTMGQDISNSGYIIGSLKNNEAIRRMYALQTDESPGSSMNLQNIITNVLCSDYELKQTKGTQFLKGNIAVIFPHGSNNQNDAAADEHDNSAIETLQQTEISNEYACSVIDFLNETSVLIENLGTLPPETLSELYDMYEITARVAKNNAADIDESMLKELHDRHKMIKEVLHGS